MNNKYEQIINCSDFEENLTEYLDKVLDVHSQKAMAAHSLRCPLCHTLVNEVKDTLNICREISAPIASLTGLEARILTTTMPETAMTCGDFETNLTDYLDGFLPAVIFHRWERHAALCVACTDLPGEVVRSIAACYSYKIEELQVPEGLNERILRATLGTSEVEAYRPSLASKVQEWLRGVSLPISVPQLAPVAMMFLFAVLVFSQTAGGSIGGMYQKSFELAGHTYQQGADIVLGGKSASQKK